MCFEGLQMGSPMIFEMLLACLWGRRRLQF